MCPGSVSIREVRNNFIFFFQQFFLFEKRFITIVNHDIFIFPVSRANVGRSSTGLEADRQCDIWLHVSALLGQNALCGGETINKSNVV